MEFRYFILSGASLEAYLTSEAREMEQKQIQHETLLSSFDIESYRPDYYGGVTSLVFKEGKQPKGMIRAHRDLPKNEVRPHAKLAAAEPIRELLRKVRVTENCQKEISSLLKLPTNVVGPHHGRSGLAMYSSRVGHVGPHVVIEVPAASESSPNPADRKKFDAHPDMKEIEAWEHLKLHADFKDFKYSKGYTLTAREA